MRIDILSWLFYAYTIGLNFSKTLAVLIFLILSIKQNLKILVFFSISKIETTTKASFSNRLFIFFYFYCKKAISVSRDKGSFSCKKVEIPVIFWYLISDCCIQEGLVIGVERILVTGKSVVSDGKFWARGK